jgi:hypothetical protein
VTSNRAQDQARPIGRGGPASAAQQHRAEPEPAGDTEPRADSSAPAAKLGRRWGVRIHWGIVFAVIASIILWLGIRTVAGLVF